MLYLHHKTVNAETCITEQPQVILYIFFLKSICINKIKTEI